jgi:hypothetical protein
VGLALILINIWIIFGEKRSLPNAGEKLENRK